MRGQGLYLRGVSLAQPSLRFLFSRPSGFRPFLRTTLTTGLPGHGLVSGGYNGFGACHHSGLFADRSQKSRIDVILLTAWGGDE